jgi:multiple sugar transport system substrate-binding protein
VEEHAARAMGWSRREFLAAGATGAAALGLAACGGSSVQVHKGGDPWRRYAGTTLNFISENTSPTAAIAANLAPFEKLTGI